MAKRAFSGDGNLLAAFPNIKRCFDLIEDRPAASRARLVGTNHPFKKERDEEALRALFPSNY
jgi:GST-like protein